MRWKKPEEEEMLEVLTERLRRHNKETSVIGLRIGYSKAYKVQLTIQKLSLIYVNYYLINTTPMEPQLD